jgi:hypothetical protein
MCDYKVWIDTVRGLEVISYLCSMARLNIMEEFLVRRIEESKCTAYFAIRCEMDREQDKEKWEDERSRKHEKARRAKEAIARGGDKALMKGKWSHLTQD